MKQYVNVFVNQERKLFYVGLYDMEKYGRVSVQCNKAKYIYNRILEGKISRVLGGFAMALVNTNYDGWEIIETEISVNITRAKKAKKGFIEKYEERGYTFVGTMKSSKTDELKEATPNNWKTKFNVRNMNIKRIREKIDFISLSMKDEVGPTIANDCYFAMTIPGRGPKSLGYGDYEVDCYQNLFRFVRNRLGYDVTA